MRNEHGKLIAIAVLSLSAVLLLCTLAILSHLPAQSAYATGPLADKGDYIVLPGGTIRGNVEAVYVFDRGAQKMAGYYVNLSRNRIENAGRFDLADLPR